MGIPTMSSKRIRGRVAGQGHIHHHSEQQLALRRGGYAGNIHERVGMPNYEDRLAAVLA
jgi:hypothetical protein